MIGSQSLLESHNSVGPAAIVQAWDSVLFDKFQQFAHLLGPGLLTHGKHAIRRYCALEAGSGVDLGCGFGDSTLALARTAGSVLGVDCSPRFIAAARLRGQQRGVHNARFAVVDVQRQPLGGPYDFAFSQFGTMFFVSPVAALRNVRRSLVPRGRLCSVVWRRREDNVGLHVAEQVVRSLVPEMHADDELTCAPGPFSMQDADVVSDQLSLAGFEQVVFERFDAPLRIGRDVAEAVEFALEMGPAGELLRLAKEEGQRLRPRVARALEDVFRQHESADGVAFTSSSWLVTARAQ